MSAATEADVKRYFELARQSDADDERSSASYRQLSKRLKPLLRRVVRDPRFGYWEPGTDAASISDDEVDDLLYDLDADGSQFGDWSELNRLERNALDLLHSSVAESRNRLKRALVAALAESKKSEWRELRASSLKPGDTVLINGHPSVVARVVRRFERTAVWIDSDWLDPREFKTTQIVKAKRGTAEQGERARSAITPTLFGPPEVGVAGRRSDPAKQRFGRFGLV